jgi:hypothetical protein
VKKLLATTTIIYLLSFPVLFAQDLEWIGMYGEESIEITYSIQQTSDEGYVMAGETWSNTAGWNDFLIVKTDADGDTLWSKKYGGSDVDRAQSINQTADGGYYIGGYTESFGAGYSDFWLLRTDDQGDTLWSRTFGSSDKFERAYCGDLTGDGGYVIAGYRSPGGEYYVVRVDSLGNELWTKLYKPNSGPYVYEAWGIKETDDKGFVIGGNGDSLYVVKTDSSGNIIWDKTYGAGDLGYDIDQTSDGGYIVTGATPVGIQYYVHLMKLDAGGDTTWTSKWIRNDNSRGHTVEQAKDGGYIVAGFTFEESQLVDSVYIIKTNAFGDSTWSRVYGGWTDDQAWDVHQTTDGGYIVGGYTASFGHGADDFFLLKLNGEGLPEIDFDEFPEEKRGFRFLGDFGKNGP